MGNSDQNENQQKHPFNLDRMKAMFAALGRGASYPGWPSGGHSQGSIPSPNARQRRLQKRKAAKLARRAHRFG